MNRILKSYFYWTYSRGSFHYDVMVTLILLFIFITPHLWNYGDKPTSTGASHALWVTGDGGYGVIVTMPASGVNMPADASNYEIKRRLKKALEPVLGDSINVERWEVAKDSAGSPTSWKIWAHR